ncbi:hypothetical protein [Pseudonocardia sp. ICBG1142]|nr:hypothetical protein [Pseudonocardia sp. ICBG1142]
MYYTTGFRRDEIQDLVAIVYEQDQRTRRRHVCLGRRFWGCSGRW